MKQIRQLFSGILACSMVLAATSLQAQSTAQGSAKVVRVDGSARFTTGNGVWQPLKTGAVLKPGTVIQTAGRSTVDLVLGDDAGFIVAPRSASISTLASDVGMIQPAAQQNMVRVSENSVLGIDRLTSTRTGTDLVTETQLDLQAGRIMGTVKKMSPTSKYEVKIPNGVAGIRGTIYTISADGVISVASGSVVIAYVGPDGTVVTKVVAAGQQFDARTGVITPLSAVVIEAIIRDAVAMQGSAFMGPTTFTQDRTVLYVSPVEAEE
jgi:hypothetical protein